MRELAPDIKRDANPGDPLGQLRKGLIRIKGITIIWGDGAEGISDLLPPLTKSFQLIRGKILLRKYIAGQPQQLAHLVVNMGLDGEVFFLPHDVVKLGIELSGPGVYFLQPPVLPLQLILFFIKRRYIRRLHLCIGVAIGVGNGALGKLPHLAAGETIDIGVCAHALNAALRVIQRIQQL